MGSTPTVLETATSLTEPRNRPAFCTARSMFSSTPSKFIGTSIEGAGGSIHFESSQQPGIQPVVLRKVREILQHVKTLFQNSRFEAFCASCTDPPCSWFLFVLVFLAFAGTSLVVLSQPFSGSHESFHYLRRHRRLWKNHAVATASRTFAHTWNQCCRRSGTGWHTGRRSHSRHSAPFQHPGSQTCWRTLAVQRLA